jgi:hypothetical protein
VVLAQPNPDTLWTRIYREGHRTWANDIQLTSDGGYIIAGFAQMDPDHLYEGCLIKIDSMGNEIWTHTYGGNRDEEFNSVQPTTDGGYIAAGNTKSFGYPDNYDNFYLVKTNSSGDTLWTRTYGGSLIDKAYCVRQTDDGRFVFTGYSYLSGIGETNCALYKIDENGDTLWTRAYGGSGFEHGNHVEQTSDGGFIIAGYCASPDSMDSNAWLIKTDAQGDSIWTRWYGGSYGDYFYSVQETSDGGYICGGYTWSYGQHWDSDGYVVKTNGVGDTMWVSVFDLTQWDDIYSIQQTFNGDYIVAGMVDFNPNVRGQMLLYKVSAEGSILWHRTYEGSGIASYGTSARQTNDGGYIVAGYTGGNLEEGIPFCYVVKTGPDEVSGVQPPRHQITPAAFTLDSVYPNPFNSSTWITYEVANSGKLQLQVYNLLGQRVGTLVNRWQAPGHYSAVWEAGEIPSGIYFFRMQTGDFSQTRKAALIR